MNNINLKGCGTALVTPFRDGEVDYEAFAALVDSQVNAGIDILGDSSLEKYQLNRFSCSSRNHR